MRKNLFERVKLVAADCVGSQKKLGEQIGMSGRTFEGYFTESRQNNLWPLLPRILDLYPQVSREWLYFNEGEPFANTPPKPQSPQATPLLGFASCDIMGWHGTMSIPVTVSVPSWHDGMVAVMASGDSMLPAGIGNGHVCYCDTSLQPAEGDAVFVEQREGISTIKLFCGREERQGAEYIKLRGWLDKKGEGIVQKDFFLSVLASHVVRVAPVVYVRRRL